MIRLSGVPSSFNSARTVDLETPRMVSENHSRANSFTPDRSSRENGCRRGNGHVLPPILEHRALEWKIDWVTIETDASASSIIHLRDESLCPFYHCNLPCVVLLLVRPAHVFYGTPLPLSPPFASIKERLLLEVFISMALGHRFVNLSCFE